MTTLEASSSSDSVSVSELYSESVMLGESDELDESDEFSDSMTPEKMYFVKDANQVSNIPIFEKHCFWKKEWRDAHFPHL